MTAQHVPGPYTYESGYINAPYNGPGNARPIAKMMPPSFFDTVDEYEATAALLIAAPDLLEALQALAAAYEARFNAAAAYMPWQPLRQARAAIAKATGGKA